MNYVPLGRTGVQVSQLCFGTMSFGAEADEKMSAKMFHRCREAGINFFDCADVYSKGKAETILGGLIADCRDKIVLTSKVYGVMGDDINARGLSRRHIMQAVEASLQRLGTDHLDLYFAHRFDSLTELEHTLRAFDDLIRDGKILYPAASNWAAWQISTALGVSRAEGLARFECIQPMYNLVKRQAETEILPLAEAERLAVISYSPLGGGMLTGKYGKFGSGKKADSGRFAERDMYVKRYSLPSYHETAQRFATHAAEHGVAPASLAVAWVMTNPAITAPIIGARNLEQLESSLAAVDIALTPEWRDEISALSPAPVPATDRLEETINS